MPQEQIQVDSLAEAYLALLKDRGVDYLFGNAGTDFASVIEALSKSIRSENSTLLKAPTDLLGKGKLLNIKHLQIGLTEKIRWHL